MMKKKIFISLIVLLLLIVIILCAVYLKILRNQEKTITLNHDLITIEYGESYKPKLSDLIDLTKYDFIDEDEVKINSDIKYEKEYPAVGNYQIAITYKDIELKQKVVVKDTIAPKVSIEEKIEVPYGTDLEKFDFEQYAKIEDLSDIINIKVDFDKADVKVSGEYLVKMIVEDLYSNVTEKEFTIFIQEQEEQKDGEETIDNTIDTSNNEQVKDTKEESRITQNNSYQEEIQSVQPQIEETQVINERPISEEIPDNTNVSNNQQEISNVEQPIEENHPVQEEPEEKIFCVDGGPVHIAGDGKNEHGYYDTWDEAWEACQEYMKHMKSGHYKVSDCFCGKYYFWVEED